MFYLAADSPSFPSKARFPNQNHHHESASGLEQQQPEPGAVPIALASPKPQLQDGCHVWPFGGPTQMQVHGSPRDPWPHSMLWLVLGTLAPLATPLWAETEQTDTRPGIEGLPHHHWMMSHYRRSLLSLQCWGAHGVPPGHEAMMCCPRRPSGHPAPHEHERGSINIHKDSSLHVRIVHCSNYIVFPRP